MPITLTQSNDPKALCQQFIQDLKPRSFFENAPLIVPTITIGNQLINQITQMNGVSMGIKPELWSMVEWRLIENNADASPFAPLSTANIHWSIFCYLKEQLTHPSALPKALTIFLAPLQNEPNPIILQRRLWALSGQLAKYQSAYLHQRPEWLKAWERGEVVLSDLIPHYPPPHYPEWRKIEDEQSHQAQIHLFRTLIQKDYQARQQKEAAFWKRIATGTQTPPRDIWVYLFDQTSARMLDFLTQLGTQSACHVHGYHLKASEHFTDDMKDPHYVARQDEEQHYDSGNYLFSRFAKHAIKTSLALTQKELTQHTHDLFTDYPNHSLLNVVKNAINRQDDDLTAAPLFNPLAPDDSLQIHGCYGLLGQLEALRHEIIKWLNADPSRQLSDILIVAPNVSHISASLTAVFPTSGHYDGYVLPAKITGVLNSDDARLWRSVRGWLLIDESIDLAQFADWLTLPETSHALQLSHEQTQRAILLLEQAGFRRCLDESALQAELHGNDNDTRHTLTHALDRLISGMLMPNSAPHAPLMNVRLADRPIIEALCGVVGSWLKNRERQHENASLWLEHLNALLETHYAAYQTTTAYQQLNSILRDLRYTLKHTPPPTEQHLNVHFLLDYVEQHLAERNTGGEPSGVITIGQIEAMRGMPYKLIVLVNADQSAFPSQQQSERHLLIELDRPKPLDFNRHHNELNAFFSTLMNAEQSAWYFYSHTDPTTGEPQLPAFPVQELLAYLKTNSGYSEENFYRKHAISPTQEDDCAPLWKNLRQQTPKATPAAVEIITPELAPLVMEGEYDLASIIRDLQKPVSAFLKRQNIQLTPPQSALPHLEPLQLSALDATLLRQKLLDAMLTEQPFDPNHFPPLPVGVIGQTLLAETQSTLKQRLQDFLHQQHATALTPTREQTIKLPSIAPHLALRATLPSPHHEASGADWLSLSVSKARLSHLMTWWLRYLLWKSTGATGKCVVSFLDETWTAPDLSPTAAQQELCCYLQLWQLNQNPEQSAFVPVFFDLITAKEPIEKEIHKWLKNIIAPSDYDHFYPLEEKHALSFIFPPQSALDTLTQQLHQATAQYRNCLNLAPYSL